MREKHKVFFDKLFRQAYACLNNYVNHITYIKLC